MVELGIDISGQRSKSVEAFRDSDLNLVITVCDDAAETCPVWLGRGSRLRLGFVDPAQARGSRQERLAVFRRVRNEMRERLFEVLLNRCSP